MEEKTFRNLQAVSIYLRGNGYRISKSTVYEHGKQRKIKPRENGLFYLAEVEQYADNYLKLKNATALGRSTDTIQNRRNEAEARKMEAQAKHWEVKAEVESGAYVERDAFERALAQRAIIFKSDLESFARSRAPEICRLVNGQNEMIPDLTEFLLMQFAIFLNRYAEERDFTLPAATNAALDDHDDEDKSDAEILESSHDNE